MNPDDSGAFHERGFCYGRLEKYDEAVEDYTEVIRLEPNHLNAYLERAWCHRRLESYD